MRGAYICRLKEEKNYLTRLFNGIIFCHIKTKRRKRKEKVKQSLKIVKKHVRLSVYFVVPKASKSMSDAELSAAFSVDFFGFLHVYDL